MPTYRVIIREKGAPELEQTLPAVSPESATRKAVADAIYMGWKHPRVVSCKEAA